MVGDDAAGILHGSVTDSQRSQRGDRWVKADRSGRLSGKDVKRFGHGGRTFVINRAPDGQRYDDRRLRL
jgi:hypothetical protein